MMPQSGQSRWWWWCWEGRGPGGRAEDAVAITGTSYSGSSRANLVKGNASDTHRHTRWSDRNGGGGREQGAADAALVLQDVPLVSLSTETVEPSPWAARAPPSPSLITTCARARAGTSPPSLGRLVGAATRSLTADAPKREVEVALAATRRRCFHYLPLQRYRLRR